MNVNNVNYKQFNITYFRYLNDCRIGYARKTDEFVARYYNMDERLGKRLRK